jgi:hypothetical protein
LENWKDLFTITDLEVARVTATLPLGNMADTEESDSVPSTKRTAGMTEDGGITPSSTSDIDVSLVGQSADP